MDLINLNFETQKDNFLPLTMTRSIYDLKVGVFTIREKWMQVAQNQNVEISFDEQEKSGVFQLNGDLLVPSHNTDLKKIITIGSDPIQQGCRHLNKPSDLLLHLQWAMLEDFHTIKHTIPSRSIPNHVQLLGNHDLILHEKCTIEHCFMNTMDGPVVIDEGAHIMQGSMLRGPVYIGKNSVVKMGTTLYQGSCIGDYCVIGGEVKNSIFHAYSNKSHHGYIGDSYIGEWCNLGAGTSCSNISNAASPVKTYDMKTNEFVKPTLKLGVIMGDHVRTAIHTAINSGTVMGPFSNIFEIEGLTAKFIPAFSWGGSTGKKYAIDKLNGDVQRWQAMKGVQTSSNTLDMINNLYKNQQ
jgi:UDP-N-acetylglucosamine diphosphorylase/glucosamine-1-phosphate N-acetyltransferase